MTTALFAKTLAQLTAGDNSTTNLFKVLVQDLGSPGAKWSKYKPSMLMKRASDEVLAFLIKPFETLSWWDDLAGAPNALYVQREPGGQTVLGTDYDVIWLDFELKTDDTPNIPARRLSDARDAGVRALIGQDVKTLTRLYSDLVLFVTISGPVYKVPELYVAGPAPDATQKNGEGRLPTVNVKKLPFHKNIGKPDGRAKCAENLNSITALSTDSKKDWRATFEHGLATLTAVRDFFREEMRAALLALMHLLEETTGVYAKTPAELRSLKEAATILVFRLMFLLEVERRGLLYAKGVNPHGLTEKMADFEAGDLARPGSILGLVRKLTRAILDPDDNEVVIKGASIFSDHPNEGFDEDALTPWLSPIAALDPSQLDASTLKQWDNALHKAGAVATGQLDKEIHLGNDRMGEGGAAHAHRVLGDVYEQILALVPSRKKKKKGQELGDLQLTLDSSSSDEDERSSLGAHYTPPELVEEIVRPALGHLFAQAWQEAAGNVDAYKKRVSELRVCDPAMGSAHFLTVAALEIAREIAWVELNKQPRHVALGEHCHEPMIHPNPIGPDPEGFDPDTRADDSDFALLVPAVYGGKGDVDEFEARIKHHLPRVVEKCVFGVDVNPIACELGKLSLWLFTLTVQQDERPTLAFLDGNIRCGNSLIGVTFEQATQILAKRMGIELSASYASQQDLFQSSDWSKLDAFIDAFRAPEDQLPELATLYRSVVADLPENAYAAAYREKFLEEIDRIISSSRWIYDLALLAEFVGYSDFHSSKSRARLAEILDEHGAELPEEAEAHDSNFWSAFFQDELEPEVTRRIKTALHTASLHLPSEGAPQRALHWELTFPDVFPLRASKKGGFDAIVANPPFVGDRKLRAFVGDEAIDFLKNFYLAGAVSDLCGFFFRKFDELVSDSGVASSLAPNTLAQAKNRRHSFVPLITGDPPPFDLIRARKSEQWPGDAAVFICMSLLVRHNPEPLYLRFDEKQRLASQENIKISSYLDAYPEVEFRQLPSMSDGVCYTGHYMRGEFFLHVQEGESLNQAIQKVPVNERTSLFAYLNNQELQQQPTPIPSRIAIDFYDDLEAVNLAEASAQAQLDWLREHRPVLLNQLETIAPGSDVSVRDFRRTLPANKKNNPHRIYWWLYAYPRINLKQRLALIDRCVGFGRVSKVWSPSLLGKIDPSTGLMVGPSDACNISPLQEMAFFGMLTSFVFEAHMRREASTLKGDVRVTPTDSLPIFPLPWKPTWDANEGRPFITQVPASTEKAIGDVVDDLLAHRQAMLEEPKTHGVPEDELNSQWGPTKLYNLYDDPEQDFDAIVKLRELHEKLLKEVLKAYGWSDLIPHIQWGFERPWIDRTTRYVPDLGTRRAIFDRLAELNEERYKFEIDLYRPEVVGLMPMKTKCSWGGKPNGVRTLVDKAGIKISDEDLVEVLRRASHGNLTKYKVKITYTNSGSPRWTRVA